MQPVAIAARGASLVSNSNWTYRRILASYLDTSPRWLDLGCGHQLLPSWMADAEEGARAFVGRCRVVVGLDRVHGALRKHATITHRVAGDSSLLPFGNASFDLVTANMVVEHVDNGARLLMEVHRVLAPDGIFLFHTPNRRYYQVLLSLCVPSSIRRRAASVIEGRPAGDVFPTYYRMNTPQELAALASAHGYVVESLTLVNSSLTFRAFAPLRQLELIVWRALESRRLAWARSNIVAVLRKV